MKILNEKPPIWDAACAAFKINPETTVFTYGDKLYNPSGQDIPEHLMVHEEVHAEQQNYNDRDAALWWGQYLRETAFRLDQEAEAYAAQFAFICQIVKDREKRFKIGMRLASSLSGPLYGNCISQNDAYQLIHRLSKVTP